METVGHYIALLIVYSFSFLSQNAFLPIQLIC